MLLWAAAAAAAAHQVSQYVVPAAAVAAYGCHGLLHGLLGTAVVDQLQLVREQHVFLDGADANAGNT